MHCKYLQGTGTGTLTCCRCRSPPGNACGISQPIDHDESHECNNEAGGSCQNTGGGRHDGVSTSEG